MSEDAEMQVQNYNRMKGESELSPFVDEVVIYTSNNWTYERKILPPWFTHCMILIEKSTCAVNTYPPYDDPCIVFVFWAMLKSTHVL